MIIDCIADLHGFFPETEGGDILIVAGDLTATDTAIEYGHFGAWMDRQNYKKKILIAGNHDNYFESKGYESIVDIYHSINIDYLCDSDTEFEGLKIWGSPWTSQFPGINPHCCAFTCYFGCDTDEWLEEKWAMIPRDTDILITHSPSFGNYDWVKNKDGTIGTSVGSMSLWMHCLEIRPKLHVFGHIHEAYGHSKHANGIEIVNASHVNERYKPVNKPIRIVL